MKPTRPIPKPLPAGPNVASTAPPQPPAPSAGGALPAAPAPAAVPPAVPGTPAQPAQPAALPASPLATCCPEVSTFEGSPTRARIDFTEKENILIQKAALLAMLIVTIIFAWVGYSYYPDTANDYTPEAMNARKFAGYMVALVGFGSGAIGAFIAVIDAAGTQKPCVKVLGALFRYCAVTAAFLAAFLALASGSY